MGLEPILAMLEYGQCPIYSSFLVWFVILINIVALFLHLANVSLTEIFTVILKIDIEYSVVVN